MRIENIYRKDNYRHAIQDAALSIKTMHLSTVGDVIKKQGDVLIDYKRRCVDVLKKADKRILMRALLNDNDNLYKDLITNTMLSVIEEDLEGELEFLLNEEGDL